jgi:hypothetical protein
MPKKPTQSSDDEEAFIAGLPPEVAEIVRRTDAAMEELKSAVDRHARSQPGAEEAERAALQWIEAHPSVQEEFKRRMEEASAFMPGESVKADLERGQKVFEWLDGELNKYGVRPQVKGWIGVYIGADG